MSLLLAGGEDTSFPNGNTPTVSTTAGWFRAGYARCSVRPGTSGHTIKSVTFPGGAVTSCWIHFQGTQWSAGTSRRYFGICDQATGKGIFVGCDSATAAKIAIMTWDGASKSQLDAEAGSSISSTLFKMDIQLTNYGAVSTIKVYLNDVLIIDFSGDSSISGISGFNAIHVYSDVGTLSVSELIVSTTDTRNLSLATLYPNNSGDTNEWDGDDYAGIDEITASDIDLIYTDIAAEKFMSQMSDVPAGTFSVPGIVIEARATKDAAASVGTLKLGVKSAGSEDVDAGQAVTTSWTSYIRVAETINGGPLSTALLDAIQLELQSAA